jgi:hypothetical protein
MGLALQVTLEVMLGTKWVIQAEGKTAGFYTQYIGK